MAASDPPPTIPALKTAFLTAQVSVLAQPLAPSDDWRASNDASSERPVADRELDAALFSLNQSLAQHARRIYAPQAVRHVAEQVNAVYLADAERRLGGPEDADGGIGRELDLTAHDAINALPPTWPSEKETASLPMEARRYDEAVKQLVSLAEQREQLQARVDRLRRIKAALTPLETGVQENLISRNGPVEKELERMRILLARVAGRVGQVPASTSAVDAQIDAKALTNARKRNVDEFLTDSAVFP
ncbi:Inner kinetochore subunit fta4 [Paramyrothecium foliicola]|nr:Inner kinetochore subunit fta4 [Paramyrothecium foliicola]